MQNDISYKNLKNNKDFKYIHFDSDVTWTHWFYNPQSNLIYMFDKNKNLFHSSVKNNLNLFFSSVNYKKYLYNISPNNPYYTKFFMECLKYRIENIGCKFKFTHINLSTGEFSLQLFNKGDDALFKFIFNNNIASQ